MNKAEKEYELANALIEGAREDLESHANGKKISQVEQAIRAPGALVALEKLHAVFLENHNSPLYGIMAFRLGAYTALASAEGK